MELVRSELRIQLLERERDELRDGGATIDTLDFWLTEEDKLAVFPVCESIRKGERVKAADARALESKLEAATVDDQDLLK